MHIRTNGDVSKLPIIAMTLATTICGEGHLGFMSVSTPVFFC